jgi:hypothetical protein
LEEYPSPETYLEEARRLSDEAEKRGLILRVMGPIALHLYFPTHVELYRRMERLGERVFTDIDYAAYSQHRGKMIDFFHSQGYEIERRALMIAGGDRHIFFGDRIPMIDVFYDRLNYNHPIDYRGRLTGHPHCVSQTDLLLQKLQIVHIAEKDLKDAMLLLLAGQIGPAGIDAGYITGLLADDWGFYHTATANLAKVTQAAEGVEVLDDRHRLRIQENASAILQQIEAAPKTRRWNNRAKIGTSKAWYNEVADW